MHLLALPSRCESYTKTHDNDNNSDNDHGRAAWGKGQRLVAFFVFSNLTKGAQVAAILLAPPPLPDVDGNGDGNGNGNGTATC